MTLYAVDAIDDAVDATRAFLWPIDRGRWARLALVVLFVGGVGGGNPLRVAGNVPGIGGPEAPSASPIPELPALHGPDVAVLAAVVALVGLLALGVALVGSVMEFVFVESLRRESVTLRRYWSDHWRRGLRLFGFRVGLGLFALGTVGLLVALALGPALLGDGGFSLGLLALAIPGFVIVAIVTGLVNGFTTAFVVPIMVVEDGGLLAAWRRFWPTLIGQWKQYAAYAGLGFVLRLVGGIVAGIATLLAAIAIAIPFGILALVGAGLLAVLEVAGWVVIGVAAVLFVLAVAAIALLVSVPVQTFLRYYALFVLGDTNGAFDLIPERRRAVRE